MIVNLILVSSLSASACVPYTVFVFRLRPMSVFSVHLMTYFLPRVISVMDPHGLRLVFRGIMVAPSFPGRS